MKRKGIIAILVVMGLLIIDQIIKVIVKTNMHLGEQLYIFDWFRIDFIENNGMAWGMELGSKLFLSIFRIICVAFLIWYIHRQVKKNVSIGYIVVLSMICAGAAGNIFDSLVYGQIFSESTPFSVAHFVPWGQGYADMLMGKVVDMFYFPLIDTTLPDWIPLVGGNRFTFFDPVFNFADSCISVGVFILLLFYRNELNTDEANK